MKGLFINQKGLEVGVSQGIGANLSDNWIACERKPNGSLRRIKSVEGCSSESEAVEKLRQYAHIKRWISVEGK